MTSSRFSRMLYLALSLVLALALVTVLAGCGKKAADTPATGPTAKGSLSAAESALSTMAPDAKLLLVQTAESVTPTATPVWGYLFGSPGSSKTYSVYVRDGEVLQASEYGQVQLDKTEWAAVPGIDDWKIDSDEAYDKALKASGAAAESASYYMGFVTYMPKSESTSTVKPFIWNVMFDPATSGVTSGTVEVNATTGATTGPK
jgi:hypothetical protein